MVENIKQYWVKVKKLLVIVDGNNIFSKWKMGRFYELMWLVR